MEAIKARHVEANRGKDAMQQIFMTNIDRMKMKETDMIDDFVSELLELSTKSETLGENIEESKLVKKFFNSLLRKINIHTYIIAALEQILDFNTTRFEDIVGRLKSYEEMICYEDKQVSRKTYEANMDSSPYQESYNSGRGRNQGGRFLNRGRGHGRYGSQQNSSYRQGKDKSKMVCYRCDKIGHYTFNCPSRLLKLQETHENDDANTQEADNDA